MRLHSIVLLLCCLALRKTLAQDKSKEPVEDHNDGNAIKRQASELPPTGPPPTGPGRTTTTPNPFDSGCSTPTERTTRTTPTTTTTTTQVPTRSPGKPGMCPPLAFSFCPTFGIRYCSSDLHCFGRLKCCPSLFGRPCCKRPRFRHGTLLFNGNAGSAEEDVDEGTTN